MQLTQWGTRNRNALTATLCEILHYFISTQEISSEDTRCAHTPFDRAQTARVAQRNYYGSLVRWSDATI